MFSADELAQIASGLLSGYQEYAAQNPQADYQDSERIFGISADGRSPADLSRNITEIIQESGSVTVTNEQLQQLVREVMAGYQAYACGKRIYGYHQFDTYLIEYLQTPQAQAILTAWLRKTLK